MLRAVSRLEGDTTLTAMDRVADPCLPVVEVSAGARIGRYVVEQRLGAGGMGVVYAARDGELARDVALKVVRPRAEVDAMEARLRREAKAMARLSHRNVVPVFDIGSHDGQLFIAMELVTGETLRSWVSAPRPWRSVAQLFARAARGLEAAHAAGLLHRDFKPDNVMVGTGDEPRITDFGLARDLDELAGGAPSLAATREGGLSSVTATGSLAGTPAYMAPEQLLRQPSGPPADQFSFCVSLFEVLYGIRPFRAANGRPDALIDEIRAGRIAKPPHTRGVPGWLHAVIARGLAFQPAERWPSMAAVADAIERGLRRRTRGRVLAAVLAGAVVTGAAAVPIAARLAGSDRAPPPSCRDVAARGNDGTTIVVCQDEYARTNDPRVGVLLAHALRRTHRPAEATALANELLATPVRGDALYTLGVAADEAGQRDQAVRYLRLADEEHRRQGDRAGAAADRQVLARLSSDVIEQLVELDQAVLDARHGHDARIEAYCHIAIALRLSEIGVRGALDEIERASALLSAPSDRLQLEADRGNVLQNLGDHAGAADAFERALQAAGKVTSTRLALSMRLNQVYSLAEVGRVGEARDALAAVRALDPEDRAIDERVSLEARIAARAGDLDRAAALIERSIAATDPADTELLDREVQRAEIALERGDLTAAEDGARRAIARIEKLRSPHPPIELRSWLITDRRIPYEILFATLARRGDAAGALAVFDRTRGLAVLAALTHGAGAPGAAFPTADLARLFPPLATSALAAPVPDAVMLDAVRGASLLALVVARDELWRITAEASRLQIERIGSLSALRARLDEFQAQPRAGVAAALGDLLVPAALARPGDRILHVVLDEPLAALPVGELVVGGRRLISARPIVQPARPSDVRCADRAPGPHRIVAIGGALPPRSAEAGAGRPALFGALRGDVLHLAVPIERDALGDALVLPDGRVRALEIAGHGGGAAQVVLASPDAGPQGTRSLAMALLAAGADQVIATVRPVSAAAAAGLVEQLTRADAGGGDLARALAHIQAAATGEDVHVGFAAFGRATCKPSP
jgi:tetratricopeptide (TPR) repeat protein/predicted Ser/Thr protein kinase